MKNKLTLSFKGGVISAVKNGETDKRFILPTIMANKYSATFIFWKWMATVQWGNFD